MQLSIELLEASTKHAREFGKKRTLTVTRFVYPVAYWQKLAYVMVLDSILSHSIRYLKQEMGNYHHGTGCTGW